MSYIKAIYRFPGGKSLYFILDCQCRFHVSHVANHTKIREKFDIPFDWTIAFIYENNFYNFIQRQAERMSLPVKCFPEEKLEFLAISNFEIIDEKDSLANFDAKCLHWIPKEDMIEISI